MSSPGDRQVHSPAPGSNIPNGGDEISVDNGSPTVQTGGEVHSQSARVADPVGGEDEASLLVGLTEDVRDQDDLERDIGRQADKLLVEQADEQDQKRIEKTKSDKDKLLAQVRKLQQRLSQPTGSAAQTRIQAEIVHLEVQLSSLETDLVQIQERIDQRHQDDDDGEGVSNGDAGSRRLPNEPLRDFLIRTGKITPFSKMGRGLVQSSSSLQDIMLDAEEGPEEIVDEIEETTIRPVEPMSHRNLLMPGFADGAESEDSSISGSLEERPLKRRKLQSRKDRDTEAKCGADVASASSDEGTALSTTTKDLHDEFVPEVVSGGSAALSEAEEENGQAFTGDEDDYPLDTRPPKGKAGSRKRTVTDREEKEDLAGVDDGNERVYQARLRSWAMRRSEARKKASRRDQRAADTVRSEVRENNDSQDIETVVEGSPTTEQECYNPHPTRSDTEFEGGYRIPGDIYPSLFDYQKTGVQWLWELYTQDVGGIIGDEMGLGKTIQVISFLAGLHYSKKITKPIIIVTPATVMKQWVNEFHRWWPPFRVSILHTSGSGMLDVHEERVKEKELLSETYGSQRKRKTKSMTAAEQIVDRVVEDGHILVTTYSGLQTYADLLIPIDWEYAVLDEGHKIRNPNTGITQDCKNLRTSNRVILSGTPMQNNLTELWSLFDFVFPMRLGTLVNFRNQFEYPIRQGGYANATNLQVQTAMKCAETLKDAISPYLLQRYKIDVAADLPQKSEQVLFCKLTKQQREAYESFLDSDDMKSIMNGKRQVLYGVDMLRKICNHPDLQEWKTLSLKAGYNYGSGAKSGKMQVVKALLELWRDTGHKTLLFCQYRITLDIVEKFLGTLGGFKYRRMDGNTPIKDRQNMVDEFNRDSSIHVFLLTTKVGGLGVNLTGADRVIIYDPDWNPSTDVQARERAWRLGQKREVMIYRLMTAGTIEEKIYHRQIFKQFLTNKILKDPKQRQTFQMKDLYDLFSLGSAQDGTTETGELFKGTEVRFGDEDLPSQAPNGDTHMSKNLPAPFTTADDATKVRDMVGVASMERFHGEKEEAKATESSKDRDSRVLESIFARSGVHSALEHDQIINGKKVITADARMIEREAKKVAADAARELQKAGEAARLIPAGTPTWTGQYGTAGRPEESRGLGRGLGRGGPASVGVLANLQNRQAPISNGHNSRGGTPSTHSSRSAPSGPRGKDFIKMIRDYLVTHGGKVHTQMLIDHFNRFCGTPERTVEFKEMLKMIATLEKGTRGRGRWVLKEEYKDRT
ncbi:MAG: hypothetical protein M1812_003304 [Candelaria pacifica]|nr:MAG: hypothetical protein M1812_003304 [Candelaria pacifica]